MAERIKLIPDELKRRLDTAHMGLLQVHKALIDYERIRYERERGPIGGPGNFLQVLIHDPFFAWLRPVSALAALIDDYVSSRQPVDAAGGEALLTQARELLEPSESGNAFQREYHRAIQESPSVAAAHGAWKQLRVGT